MKKVILFVSMLCCTLSGFAEAKPIKLEIKDLPNERSLVQSPTASIEDELLTIEYLSCTTFSVSIINNVGKVVYSNDYCAESAILTLNNLPIGEYTLVVMDDTNTYSGEFENVEEFYK